MKVGDLVRCVVHNRTGTLVSLPRTPKYTCIKPSGFIVVLWSDGTRGTVHLNNVKVIA
jgi:hypothetical protein